MTRLALVGVLVLPLSVFMTWAAGPWAACYLIPYGLYIGYLVHLIPARRQHP